MKSAGKLIVNTAAGHFFQGAFRHGAQVFFSGLLKALKNQIER